MPSSDKRKAARARKALQNETPMNAPQVCCDSPTPALHELSAGNPQLTQIIQSTVRGIARGEIQASIHVVPSNPKESEPKGSGPIQDGVAAGPSDKPTEADSIVNSIDDLVLQWVPSFSEDLK